MRLISSVLAATLVCLFSAKGRGAQQSAASPAIVFGASDFHLAPAGTYSIDSEHVAVIARVSHLGYAYSVFRFGNAAGTLRWDPADPDRSRLSATVQTASIETNVPGFAKELAGSQFLKSATYPDATFAASAFHQRDATHGTVDGMLTLMGHAKSVTFDATLVGAGPGFFGHPRMGIHAETAIDPTDFGLSTMFGHRLELVIDAEFQKT